MKTLTLTIAALAMSAMGSAPAFAGSSDHSDQADYITGARGQMQATQSSGSDTMPTLYEGRQAVRVAPGLSADDALRLQLMTTKDANSNR